MALCFEAECVLCHVMSCHACHAMDSDAYSPCIRQSRNEDITYLFWDMDERDAGVGWGTKGVPGTRDTQVLFMCFMVEGV